MVFFFGVDFLSQDRCCYLLSAGGFEINVKYNNGKNEFINQKSIGKTIALFKAKDVE